MAKEQGIAKAIRCTKAAIEMLDRAADSLNVDDSHRKRIVAKRQDVEDLLDELNQDIHSSITDPKDDGSCDPLRGTVAR